jgi:hypothetical protein
LLTTLIQLTHHPKQILAWVIRFVLSASCFKVHLHSQRILADTFNTVTSNLQSTSTYVHKVGLGSCLLKAEAQGQENKCMGPFSRKINQAQPIHRRALDHSET